MSRIIQEIINQDGVKKQYRCAVDLSILWQELDNGVYLRGDDCEHFYWEPVGNGCYPFQLDSQICNGIDDILRRYVKKIWSGTSIWFLLPRT